MLTALVIIHILISIVLILSILLQSGKGGSLAGALGGSGAAGAVLGTRGAATMLGRITTYSAVLFLVSCLGLSLVFKGGGGEQIQTAAQKESARRRTGLTPLALPPAPVQQQAPALPASPAPAAEKK